ncbi:uncharacterized protein LOC114530775 [Dendronephthya gigantea]|uniref:uncharacterized protein LOC114530775 n=1 Tax=Dendronephthya gigantea TaxID=151771 RepID=UPI00106A40E2|nr:uncharacterized protein LOC114530775 [Dendronephthya gigantea]XP_028408196.1 uncharacterized protein LOC114530775 [Dendronephthya gigantea]XP_028408198.1 uncharacterized protein LOC114530775 [Dendronephthya gigantea]
MAEQLKTPQNGDELLCYVHNVKPVQKSGKVNYVTCQLQTKSSMEKAICFSPEKVTPLKVAMASKSPIKMKNFDYNTQYNNYVIKKSTNIENPGVLDFQIQDLEKSSVLIKDINTIPQGELITVKASVAKLGGIKVVATAGGPLKKVEAILVDTSGSIKAVFWAEWVNSIELDQVYTFTNLRVREDGYTKEKIVNSAKQEFSVTQSTPFTSPLAEIELSLSDLTTKTARVSVIGVKAVSKYFICSSCKKKMENPTQIVKCQSCKLIQKLSTSNIQWFIKLFVVDEKTKDKFYLSVFHHELVKLLEVNDNKTTTESEEDDILLAMLQLDTLNVTYNISGKLLDFSVSKEC